MDIIKICKDILIQYKEVTFAYLFGSYVRGTLRSDSDIDIAIYLSEEMDIDSYLGLKMDLTEACKREVDLVILNKATPLLKFQVYKENRSLFTRDKSAETNFKVKTLFEYNDVKRYLDLSYKKNIERIRKEVELDG